MVVVVVVVVVHISDHARCLFAVLGKGGGGMQPRAQSFRPLTPFLPDDGGTTTTTTTTSSRAATPTNGEGGGGSSRHSWLGGMSPFRKSERRKEGESKGD